MIEKLTDNVYRVLIKDLKENLTEVVEELRDTLMCNFTQLVIMKPDDVKLNGSQHFIEGIENDYTKYYLIIIKRRRPKHAE